MYIQVEQLLSKVLERFEARMVLSEWWGFLIQTALDCCDVIVVETAEEAALEPGLNG